MLQTFPGYSLLLGHHEDSTKVGLLLTEPSQVIEAGPGQVCFDLSCVLIAGAYVSARGQCKNTYSRS